jgi:hypothetical protein
MSTFLGWVSSNLILALLNLKMYIYFIHKIPIVETYFTIYALCIKVIAFETINIDKKKHQS